MAGTKLVQGIGAKIEWTLDHIPVKRQENEMLTATCTITTITLTQGLNTITLNIAESILLNDWLDKVLKWTDTFPMTLNIR